MNGQETKKEDVMIVINGKKNITLRSGKLVELVKIFSGDFVESPCNEWILKHSVEPNFKIISINTIGRTSCGDGSCNTVVALVVHYQNTIDCHINSQGNLI